jgi:hypothetical protein
VTTWKVLLTAACAAVAAVAVACGGGDNNPAPAPTPAANVTAPTIEAPANDAQLDTLRPTLTVRNASSDQAGSRTYEFQVSDTSGFASTTSSAIAGFASTTSKAGVAEGSGGTTSMTLDTDLQPTTVFYWRVRAVQGSSTGPWSTTGRFKSRLVGFSRNGELYDPLIHGETVGERIGSTTFIPGKGLKLDNVTSLVRYRLPATISDGEFSMDVEGIGADGPGNKAKVFGMQEGTSDFITNRYRVDIQYRGVRGAPPNCITFRVLYGSGSDLDVRYELTRAQRNASVRRLDASTTYRWKATWGGDFRLMVLQGGEGGAPVFDFGMPTPNGRYAPDPQVCYLGAPVDRSGAESATIAGAIYRNVWIGSRARPETLGNALDAFIP